MEFHSLFLVDSQTGTAIVIIRIVYKLSFIIVNLLAGTALDGGNTVILEKNLVYECFNESRRFPLLHIEDGFLKLKNRSGNEVICGRIIPLNRKFVQTVAVVSNSTMSVEEHCHLVQQFLLTSHSGIVFVENRSAIIYTKCRAEIRIVPQQLQPTKDLPVFSGSDCIPLVLQEFVFKVFLIFSFFFSLTVSEKVKNLVKRIDIVVRRHGLVLNEGTRLDIGVLRQGNQAVDLAEAFRVHIIKILSGRSILDCLLRARMHRLNLVDELEQSVMAKL